METLFVGRQGGCRVFQSKAASLFILDFSRVLQVESGVFQSFDKCLLNSNGFKVKTQSIFPSHLLIITNLIQKVESDEQQREPIYLYSTFQQQFKRPKRHYGPHVIYIGWREMVNVDFLFLLK